VRGDFAVTADLASFLNLHKGADPRSLADRAPVQIDEIGVGNHDTITSFDVINRHHFSPLEECQWQLLYFECSIAATTIGIPLRR
jgi:hypothetical protein